MTWQNDRITAIPAPEPVDYDRQYSFTDFEALHPANPKPASGLEAEFNAIQQALDETQARARLIQRSDGALANESVGVDQLKSDVQIGVNPPTAWTAFTGYTVRDSVVFNNEAWYVCLVAHTSGADFATDLAAGKWQLIFDFDDLLTTEVQAIADEAAASATAAAASAASLNLPELGSGDAGKLLVVNPTYDGYDLDVTIAAAATASTVVKRDASGRMKAANPADADDVATKAYADSLALADGAVTTAKLADEAVTKAKLADEAVTKAKLDPALFLTAGTTVSLSVETTPAGATQFADIQSAISYARENYIPAGGTLNITVNKTALSSVSDVVTTLRTDDLSWINLIFVSGNSYTIAGQLINCSAGGRSPIIKNTGSCTITTTSAVLMTAAEFGLIQIRPSSVLTLAGGYISVFAGGRVTSNPGTLSMNNDSRCISMLTGGEFICASSFSAECTGADVVASVGGRGTRFVATGSPTMVTAGSIAVQVVDGATAVLQGLTATSSGTNVNGTTGCFINLGGSTATCNLTNNTVSTNGILIR